MKKVLYKLFIKILLPFRVAIRFEIKRELKVISDQNAEILRELKLIDKRQNLAHKIQSEASRSTANFIIEKMNSAKLFDDKLKLIDYALALTKNPRNAIILEFGVFEGETLNYMASKWLGKLYGFDSFEGLPEDWRAGFGKGFFATGNIPIVPENVELIKGWFEEALPKFVESNEEDIAIVHIDCDLYSSTKTVFEVLSGRLKPGTLILFDEYFNYPGWEMGEHKAMLEFAKSKKVGFEYLAYNQMHEQVLVRLI